MDFKMAPTRACRIARRDTALAPQSIMITRKATAVTVRASAAKSSSKHRTARPTFRDTRRAITDKVQITGKPLEAPQFAATVLEHQSSVGRPPLAGAGLPSTALARPNVAS